jgi:hypothetical protein
VAERDGLFSVDPAQGMLLRYYANSIAHLLVDPVAAAPAPPPAIAAAS